MKKPKKKNILRTVIKTLEGRAKYYPDGVNTPLSIADLLCGERMNYPDDYINSLDFYLYNNIIKL